MRTILALVLGMVAMVVGLAIIFHGDAPPAQLTCYDEENPCG